MTQLILDTDGYNILLPESIKGGYSVSRDDLSEQVTMITGRIVRELRGTAWNISYQYGYFDGATKDAVIAACEKGRRQAITCGFLTPDSTGELTYSSFFVTAITYPSFMWSRDVTQEDDIIPVPVWANFAVKLREVRPSD